jgi:hypothetical protein
VDKRMEKNKAEISRVLFCARTVYELFRAMPFLMQGNYYTKNAGMWKEHPRIDTK